MGMRKRIIKLGYLHRQYPFHPCLEKLEEDKDRGGSLKESPPNQSTQNKNQHKPTTKEKNQKTKKKGSQESEVKRILASRN